MNLKEFKKQYNYVPFELHEFAEAAKEIINCKQLSEAAEQFLKAKEHFDDMLTKFKIEVG